MKTQSFILLLCIFCLTMACKKQTTEPTDDCLNAPATPEIKFKSIKTTSTKHQFTGAGQDSLTITVVFKDKEYDLGFGDKQYNEAITSDMSNPDKFNYIMTIFRKKNGKFEIFNSAIPFSFIFPTIDSVKGRNVKDYPISAMPVSSCSGELTYSLLLLNDFTPPNDTLKFEIQLMDNAFHKSNVIMTDEIILNKK